jgi:hypothetical protein
MVCRYICIPKIPIWLCLGVPWNGHLEYLRLFAIFYGHLVYFLVIWYIFWSFGIFSGHLVYFLFIWYIFCSFGIFSCNLIYFYDHLLYFMTIWYTFSHLGMLYQEKSGNPDRGQDNRFYALYLVGSISMCFRHLSPLFKTRSPPSFSNNEICDCFCKPASRPLGGY